MMTSQGPINANDKLPWGWHFRPTGAELINSLKKKVKRQRREWVFEPEDLSEVLREIDLSQVEPWEVRGIAETCSIRAAHADEHNQYFYTQKEQKYRNGKRSNRATKGGFWKATGRDKPIYGKINLRDKNKRIIGYRKALVFYEGRAPNGNKTDWILHEYRLETDPAFRDEQWVACHMFIKERNVQQREPQEGVELRTDMPPQPQYNEWADVLHLPQITNVKPEPGYPTSSTYMGSIQPLASLCPPEQVHLPFGPQYRDEYSLPHLVEGDDESNYSVHAPNPVETVGQLFRPATGRIPSFSDPRIADDILFNIYAEQQTAALTYENLW